VAAVDPQPQAQTFIQLSAVHFFLAAALVTCTENTHRSVLLFCLQEDPIGWKEHGLWQDKR
jgi:hypothetical protein